MISPCPPYYSSALSCLLLSDIEKLGCGCHTRAPKPISVSCVRRGAEARTHPMESSILRLTRAVQTTSVASTPQNVSGLAVGQGNHARIFVDLKLCGDRSACRVLTPPSAPGPTVLTSSKLRFWLALKGMIKEKTFTVDKGVELTIAGLLPKKFVSFLPKDEVVRLRCTQQPAALTAKRLIECTRPCTDRKCHVALKQRKALNVAVTLTCI